MFYSTRNAIIHAMGFADYRAYLASDLWAAIRVKVFALFGQACHYCGEPATQVHHRRYTPATMRGEDVRYLYPVCRPCHEVGEFEGDMKVSPLMATRRMRKLCRFDGYAERAERRQKILHEYHMAHRPNYHAMKNEARAIAKKTKDGCGPRSPSSPVLRKAVYVPAIKSNAPVAVSVVPVAVPDKYVCAGCRKKFVSRIRVPVCLGRWMGEAMTSGPDSFNGSQYACSDECAAKVRA